MFPTLLRRTSFWLALLLLATRPVLAAIPSVSAFSPTSGVIGNKITITGSGFTGATVVTFGGVTSVYTINSDIRITATLPRAAASGPVSVTTVDGTGNSVASFIVAPGMQLTPAGGTPQATTTIYGAGFHGSVAVDLYFDTVDTALVVASPTGTLAATLRIPATAQPGTHWITYVERGSSWAAQAAFNVNTNWPMIGFGSQGRGNNPFENTLNPANVSSLTTAWSGSTSIFGNPSPVIVAGGNAYVSEVLGRLFAYSNSGTLLWTATIGDNFHAGAPVAYGPNVYFGDDNGNVNAFAQTCRTDGGVCTPRWTTNVGTGVTASLATYKGMIYAPSSDGTIHVINPATGADGTPIYGINNTSGAVTTPPAFTADGSFYYGNGTYFQFRTSNSAGQIPNSGSVSPFAVFNGAAYYTTSEGTLHKYVFGGWSAATSSGCAPAPAYTPGRVIAGGCTTLAAYNVKSGAVIWSVATQAISGISTANGIVFTCDGNVLEAYDANSGAYLWSGGGCTGPPIVSNGVVYGAYAGITAYDLAANVGASALSARPPAIGALQPDLRLRPQRLGIVEAN